jgi:hypothetical protein
MSKACHGNTTVLNFLDEMHDHMVMNRFLRINADCESENAFIRWMDDHLATKPET